MAPTTNKEHQILTSFLLPPAPLPSIITLEQFASFFPPSASESEIQKLFRHLTHTRSLTIDAVAENIDDEVRRGISQKRAVVRGRRLAEQDEVEDEEILVEQQLFGSTSNLPHNPRHHTPKTVVPVLERAVDESERELEAMEAEAAQLLDGIKNTVGGLSDLRYGKLANQNLGKQIVKNLNSFVEANTNGGK